MDSLKKRVEQFKMLQLPGQPMGMHMGTYHLIVDLEAQRDELLAALKSVLDLVEIDYRDAHAWLTTDYKEAKMIMDIAKKAVKEAEGTDGQD